MGKFKNDKKYLVKMAVNIVIMSVLLLCIMMPVTTGLAAPPYAVTYSGNGNTGGEAPVDSKQYSRNATVTVLGNTGNLVKTGYTFAGWNTAANGSGTNRAVGSTFRMPGNNVTLYAKWTANTYTITYNGNGSTGGTVPTDSNAYVQGATVTVKGNTGTLLNPGYTFAGWNTNPFGTGTDYAAGAKFNMGAANVTLYAKWTASAQKVLKVLEVQPGPGTAQTSAYQLQNGTVGNLYMAVTHMPMFQFISTIDELNGKYDIIFIGNHTYQDTVANRHYKLSFLNRSSTVTVRYSAAGFHYTTLQTGSSHFVLPQGGNNETDSWENYSPNDIINRQAALLEDYIQSGQLTVFADTIFTDSNLQDTILYNKFLTYRNNSSYPNFHSLASISLNDLAAKYASANQRPSLSINTVPLEYDGSNAQADNKTMSFGFDVNGPNPLVASLFIDVNGDGVFTDAEKVLASGTITTNIPAEGSYSLNYRVPDSFTGLQPWKLVLEDTVTHVKNYSTGYTAFKGSPLNVRVLQLIPASGTTLNIQTGLLQPLSKTGEYNISVTVMKISDFDNNCPNPAPTTLTGVTAPTKLNANYDMVILGFADIYGNSDLKQSAAIQELKNFITTGQSVMFTHDSLTFDTNNTTGWDYNLTKQFRDLIGQNIYQQNALQDPADPYVPADLSNRLPYPSATNKSYGFSRLTLDRANNGNEFPTATSTAKLNDGLITKYPYILGNTLSVATTHHQYYQLDLEDPSLVPWFTLAGTGFNSLDGRNDYYTYTRGNITFSGTGHSAPNNAEEQKLFVNTIIKAARGANHAPVVDIYDLNNGQEIYNTQDKLDFSFKASDLDITKDNILKVSIAVTDNDSRITTQVTDFITDNTHYTDANLDSNHAFSVQNNSTVQISMPKIVSDTTGNFSIEVTAQDTSQATGTKKITLRQVSPPSLTVSTAGNNYYLVNDSGETTFRITPYNNPGKDMTNIQLIIDKDQTGVYSVSTDAVSNISDSGNTITIDLPDYLVNDIDHWTEQQYVIHTLFQAPSDTKLNYHLKFDTMLNDVSQTVTTDRSIDFHIQSGEIRGEVKDHKGRSIKNIQITVTNGNNEQQVQTSSTGAYSFTNLKSGTYTVSAAGRNGDSVDVKTGAQGDWTLNSNSVSISLSNSPSDSGSYQKEVDFRLNGTLMNNINLFSLTNEVETECVPNGIAYAKLNFSLNRPVKTMTIDLDNAINNQPVNELALKNVTFTLNGIDYPGSFPISPPNEGYYALTLPADLPSGSYELVISLGVMAVDNQNLVVPGNTLIMQIKDIITSEENADQSDTISPSNASDKALFGDYILKINIKQPPSIL